MSSRDMESVNSKGRSFSVKKFDRIKQNWYLRLPQL